ncbi:MAG: hypothetical protein K2I77_00450, partial [Anaeroplasmataceae bacterium]|nr:hypothetical protein [Anaeroplasmataceae bacterium]
LFGIHNEFGIFISPFSLNDAYEKYYKYAMDEGILTLKDCQTLRHQMYSKNVIEESYILPPGVEYEFPTIDTSIDEFPIQEEYIKTENPTIGVSTYSNKDTYVKGTLTWLDDDGVSHPLRRVMIRIYDKQSTGETHIGTVFSDNEGNFSFTFQNKDQLLDFENGGLDIFVRIYAGDNNALVRLGDNSADYYHESPVSENMATGSTKICNYNFTMDSDLGKAFQISQAILTARDFAWNMMGEKPNDVTARYPYDTHCYYSSDNKQIVITGIDKLYNNAPEPYASWDAIMHEYGHHIEYQLDIIESDGWEHSFNKNYADFLNNKLDGIHLAWGEAWATVFGMIGQDYWKSYLTNIKTVCDTEYFTYNFKKSVDIEKMEYRIGDACEGSVAGVLWDLYDFGTEEYDTLCLGAKGFWNATTQNQNKTFSDFMKNFYEMYPQFTNSIGENLVYYKIAPTFPLIINASQSTPPTFHWYVLEGSKKYPNNKFRIYVYNTAGAILFKSDYTTDTSYTLTQEEWDAILYSFGTTYSVAVAGMQTDEYVTGEYISMSKTFNKPNPASLTERVTPGANSRFMERTANLQPGQCIDYTFVFEICGRHIIQTFGPYDTIFYLYDSNGIELTYDDDSGYFRNAFLSYEFEKDIEYTLRVRFYTSSQSGEIRLTILQNSDFYSSYEDITQRSPDCYTYSGTLQCFNSFIITYVSSTTEEVTFTAESEFTDMLYIIDPRSTNTATSYTKAESVYCDGANSDYGTKIKKQMDEDVPYLIILIAMYTSTDSGNYNLYIS